MQKIYKYYDLLTNELEKAGEWVWPLLLRFILAWEFLEAGLQKFNGQNWFGSVQDNFPIPFAWLSADVNWFFATWGELTFSVLLFLGLFTRFAAISLIVITGVATAAVHWPESWNSISELWNGYAISNKGAGNFKLPLLYILMLIPLVFHGGGKLSLDKLFRGSTQASSRSAMSLALIAAVLAAALIWTLPKTGIVLLIIAGVTGFISSKNQSN